MKTLTHLFRLQPGLYSVRLREVPDSASQPLYAVAFFPPSGDASRRPAFVQQPGSEALVIAPRGTPAIIAVPAGDPAVLHVTEFGPTASLTMDRAVEVKLLELDAGEVVVPENAAVPEPAALVVPASAPPVTLSISVQKAGEGEFVVGDGAWAGGEDDAVQLEGFSISVTRSDAELGIEYQCGNPKLGLTPWVKGGRYCGTRGKGIPLTKFAIRLTGRDAQRFEIRYRGIFVGHGAGPSARNGEICQGLAHQPLAAIFVEILQADAGEVEIDAERQAFDEQEYLRLNPDVATAVSLGEFRSGYLHYLEYGKAEGRPVRHVT